MALPCPAKAGHYRRRWCPLTIPRATLTINAEDAKENSIFLAAFAAFAFQRRHQLLGQTLSVEASRA
jgi:hypothetical protein